MTSIGKFLVLLNVGLSLMAATWAQGLYANRIDLTNQQGKDGAADGALVSRIARIAELNKAIAPAGMSWNVNRAVIAELDIRRRTYEAWYDKELALLRTEATEANPAHVVKIDRGLPVISNPTKDFRPDMVEGRDQFNQPLLSLAAYRQALDLLQQQLDGKSKDLTKVIQQDTLLTNQIAGDQAAAPKGLQQRVLDERAKLFAALQEETFVRPLLINATIDLDQISKRQRQLLARVGELEKTGVAAR